MKFQSKCKHFHSRKCVWTCRQRNGGHFVSASMCLVESLQLIWSSGTRRWNLRMSDPQMTCGLDNLRRSIHCNGSNDCRSFDSLRPKYKYKFILLQKRSQHTRGYVINRYWNGVCFLMLVHVFDRSAARVAPTIVFKFCPWTRNNFD